MVFDGEFIDYVVIAIIPICVSLIIYVFKKYGIEIIYQGGDK